MGQQKKSVSLELTDPVQLKEAGNKAYKKEDLDEALACYTKGGSTSFSTVIVP